jgi:F-type H+-transporting ATPase subunit delta
MLTEIESIAKKYAIAYLNLYFNELSSKMIGDLARLRKFLYKNRNFYAYLSMPKLSANTKLNFIDRLCNAFNLAHGEVRLIHLLIEQNRIELLDAILKKIVEEYHIKKGIVLLSVYVSHEIDEKQKAIINEFVQNLIKKNIEIRFLIDKNLINGIRIKSSTQLWENSARKHLKILKNNLFQQAIL